MHRIKGCCLLVVTGVVLTAGFAQTGGPSYLSKLPSGERWIQHLTTDLLPFWTLPSALGYSPRRLSFHPLR